MFKKLLSVMLVCTMVLLTDGSVFTYASEGLNETETDSKMESIVNDVELKELSSNTEAVLIDEKAIENFDKDEIEELMDDGICLLETCSDAKEINEYFGEEICEENDALSVIGYKIEKNGEDIVSEPIAVEAVDTEGNEINKGSEFEELIDNIEIDMQDYDILVNNVDNEDDYLDQLSEKNIAYLQGANPIGKSYSEATRTTYYYGKSGLSTDTKALEKTVKAGKGWNKMGFSTITLSVFNVGGSGKKRYDLFMGNMQVGPLNGYWMTEFHGQMRLYNQNSCSIIDTSTLKGDANENVSTSIGAGLGASESGISASLSAGYSYSYNPSGMKIVNYSGDSELQPCWKCTKKLKDCYSNERYNIKPSIVVKSPKGKTKETKVSMRVKKLYFTGEWQSYYIGNTSGSEYVYITVKNHKKVKLYE